jgi:hypothetical protein
MKIKSPKKRPFDNLFAQYKALVWQQVIASTLLEPPLQAHIFPEVALRPSAD